MRLKESVREGGDLLVLGQLGSHLGTSADSRSSGCSPLLNFEVVDLDMSAVSWSKADTVKLTLVFDDAI
jgi:hypothetical protein